MIVSFKDEDTHRLAEGYRVNRFRAFERVALRKLRQLQVAGELADLRVPPGNKLEALKGEDSKKKRKSKKTQKEAKDG